MTYDYDVVWEYGEESSAEEYRKCKLARVKLESIIESLETLADELIKSRDEKVRELSIDEEESSDRLDKLEVQMTDIATNTEVLEIKLDMIAQSIQSILNLTEEEVYGEEDHTGGDQ